MQMQNWQIVHNVKKFSVLAYHTPHRMVTATVLLQNSHMSHMHAHQVRTTDNIFSFLFNIPSHADNILNSTSQLTHESYILLKEQKLTYKHRQTFFEFQMILIRVLRTA